MFNTARFHRWITVPAIVLLFAALVASRRPALAFLMAPPVLALPLIAHAALRRTAGAIELGLDATRVIGWMMIAWAVIGAILYVPLGLIMLAAAILFLVTAGSEYDERRLAAVTILIGAYALLATVLLVWIRVHPAVYAPAAVGLIVGGIAWLGEARRAPLTTEVIPTMTIATRGAP